jgi:hypothetical protein
MQHVTRPKNQLQRLQRMVANPDCRDVHWERALHPTSQRLGVSMTAAEAYIVATVQMLSADDFVRPVQQSGAWFDVYAIYRDGLGWWVKVGEDEDGVLVISHHAPERGPETTALGRMIHPTEPVTESRETEES